MNAHDLKYHAKTFDKCNSPIGRLYCLGLSAQATLQTSISMPGHVKGIRQLVNQ